MGFSTLEGISIRPFRLGERGSPVLLDADGGDFNSILNLDKLGFILSDDQPFSIRIRPVFTV